MAVANTHARYKEMAPLWKRARDAVAGQRKVHAMGDTYLPRLKDQDEADYASYKSRASWFGATFRTTTGLVGMLFRKPPKVRLPAGVMNMIDDIDLSGKPLNVMAQEMAEEVLTVGRVSFLVDYPPVLDVDGKPTVMTVAQKEALGLRPSLQMYKTERVLNWKFRRVGLAWALCQVVLEEDYVEEDGEFGQSLETRWRVLDLDQNDEYRQRVFRKDKQKDLDIQVGPTIWPLMNGTTMKFIPFYSVGVEDVDICPDVPPLNDLVDLNFQHYRVTADYEHGCHFCGLPTPYVAGYSPELKDDGSPVAKLYVGSPNAWIFPDPNTKVGYLEFHGTGLKTLQDNLDRKETLMAIVGSRMLAKDNKGRSNETATAIAVNRVGESSILANIAMSISSAFERALKVFCDWAGASGEIEYQINRDFMPVLMDSNMFSALVNGLTTGNMSFDNFWDLLQRGDMAPLDVTAEEEKERIKKNPPPVPKPPPEKAVEPAPKDKPQGASAGT